MSEKSLYDTIAGFFGGKEETPPAPPKPQMSPEPPKPVKKPGESDLDFSLRMMKYKNEMERRRLYPSEFVIAEAPVVPAEKDRFDRRRQIEEAIDAND